MCKTISKKRLAHALAKVASKTYQDMLFNAITGRLSVYNESLLGELQRRRLVNAAASDASNSESPIKWNYFVNWRSEPEGSIEREPSVWGPLISESAEKVSKEMGEKKGSLEERFKHLS
jgi:hypothetical protein